MSLYSDIVRRIETNLVLFGLLLCGLYWILESIIQAYIFDLDKLSNQLFNPDSNTIWLRMLAFFIIIFASSFIQAVINRRKSIEMELRDSQEKYGKLFQHCSEAIFLHDLGGTIIDYNHVAAQLLGYNGKELIGETVVKLHPEKEFPKAKAALNKISSNNSINFEIEFRKKNGITFPTEVSATIININGKRIIQGLVRDISERKKNERIQSVLSEITRATLISSNQDDFFRIIHQEVSRLIDATNFYIALYDLESNEYSFPYCVDELEEDESFEPQELNHSLTDYVRRQGKSLFADTKTHMELIDSGEVQLVGQPSHIWVGVPLESSNDIIGVMVVQSYSDANLYSLADMHLIELISNQIALLIQRIQNEKALKNEHSICDAIIEQANEGLCVCHNISEFPNVKFTIWNNGMTKLTGYTMDEINNQGWYQTVYPDPDYQMKAKERMDLMRNGNNLDSEEWKITCADGTIRKIFITTSVVAIHDDNTVNVLAIMTPVANDQPHIPQKADQIRQLSSNT